MWFPYALVWVPSKCGRLLVAVGVAGDVGVCGGAVADGCDKGG